MGEIIPTHKAHFQPHLASSPLVGEDGGEGGSFLEQNADSFEKEPHFFILLILFIMSNNYESVFLLFLLLFNFFWTGFTRLTRLTGWKNIKNAVNPR